MPVKKVSPLTAAVRAKAKPKAKIMPPTAAEKTSAVLKKSIAKTKAAKPVVTRGPVYWDDRFDMWCINLCKILPCKTVLVACMEIKPGELGEKDRVVAEKAAIRIYFPNPFV